MNPSAPAAAWQPGNDGPAPRVLVVEDESLLAQTLALRLKRRGFDTAVAESLSAARDLLRRFDPHAMLLDVALPDGNSLAEFPTLVRKPDGGMIPTVVMSAYGQVQDAVLALQGGALTYVEKPFDMRKLDQLMNRALEISRPQIEAETETPESVSMIGQSEPMLALRARLERLAKLQSRTGEPGVTVLITGETGTGKDVAARWLHAHSRQSSNPFMAVDCAALPRELVEDELFGHEKGAFTGAGQRRIGLLEAAGEGTVFLDEIGELPIEMQAKLLHVIERRCVRPVGSTTERPVLGRFVAATNRSLPAMITAGQFRADLYYRLNVLQIEMPPLRDRGHDILLLANHFLAQTRARYDVGAGQFSEEARRVMLRHPWPGNVRELRNAVERAVLICPGTSIGPECLQLGEGTQPCVTVPTPGLVVERAEVTPSALLASERRMVDDAMARAKGNVSEAARILGITRQQMRTRLVRLERK